VEPRYDLESALARAVTGDRRMLNVARPEDEAVLGTDGILAAPLVDLGSAAVVGMIKVEALPLQNLRPESLQAFRGLCEWVGGAYRKAQAFEEANRARVNVPGSQLFSDAFYQSVTAFLLALAARARFEVSQLTIGVRLEGKAATADNSVAVRQIVAAVATTGLRSTDLAFDYYEASSEFLVVLPMTPAANCQIVTDRLRVRVEERLRERSIDGRVKVTYENLYTPTPDDVKPWHRPQFRRTSPYGIAEETDVTRL
jgi:hypothetical protein